MIKLWCNMSSKGTFLILLVVTIILTTYTVFRNNQDLPSSIVTLSSVLRLNRVSLYLQNRHLTAPVPTASWNVTSVPSYNGSIVANNVSMPTRSHPGNWSSKISASSRPPSCSPVQNIAYIKTLKTGSTTLQTIINRYGFFHNLSFILNRESSKNGHFYHLPFTEEVAETHFLPPIHVAADDFPNYRNYNMMAVHVRYQRDVMEKYFAPDTQYMTIVRDPGMQWESAFNHFQFHDAILLNLITNSKSSALENDTINALGNSSLVNGSLAFRGCRKKLLHTPVKSGKGKGKGKTIKQKNCSIPKLIEEFMANPNFYQERLRFMTWEGEMGKRWAYARNNQIYDLGMERERHDNMTSVKEWIFKLQDELTLVLINEYFDESLLIMRKLFCWSFQDIAYIAKNVRINVGNVSITGALRDKIREWNAADTLLYSHFNRTLWRRIADYGPGFESDLNYFRNLLGTVLRNCTQEAVKTLWNGEHLYGHQERVPRDDATLFCRTLAESKTELHYRIYCRQDINRTAEACQKKV
eukprot:XP_011668190.1 PREDICTED: galactosylceramide sulfotransferase-like [Strongylocentrotus purpuratus]